MVLTDNGTEEAATGPAWTLPEVLHLSTTDSNRVPSPGTQRALKAETGRSFDELFGGDADSADRWQTIIWARLRTDRPGLRWDQCAEVEVVIEEATAPDPLAGADSESSPRSVDSGA